jgi:carboxypeptidase Taq
MTNKNSKKQKNSKKNKTESQKITELKKRLVELSHLSSALSVLHWDLEVNMPPKGAPLRAATISELSGMLHAKFITIDHDNLLSDLKKKVDSEEETGDTAVIINNIWRDYIREKKLPGDFVREMAETTSRAQIEWIKARQQSNFKLFEPWLKKIVDLKRKEAKLIGYKESPYDALLDAHEPGMTTAEAAQILNDLKDFLVPFLKRIKASKKKINRKKLEGKFPIPDQKAFNELIAREIGFDLEAGKIDISAHPFTITFNPSDVRFTTRYDEHDLGVAIGSTIHEAGHGMYEQGLLAEHFGTPLSEAISLGVHESQSRLWENMVGKSPEFWNYMYAKLRKAFPKPFSKISVQEFYDALNLVTPSLIRVEADEVTYNLHIIIRFEIEKELIEGSIEVKDAPNVWNDKVKNYLGLKVPNNAEGILQDVHWSHGAFGYFPTYSFGTMYAAQFFATLEKDIPDIKKKISNGEFKSVLNWLRKKIHIHGKRFTADELSKEVTGESLNAQYFKDYITKKFSKIYNLK